MITCIIPFYNENSRILKVLETITKMEKISEIICVDDGSKDGASEKIKRKFRKIEIISHRKNQGKSAAIQSGLKSASSKKILLIDADIQNLIRSELQYGLDIFSNSKTLDMLILRSKLCPWRTRMFRHDIIFSGIRFVKKEHLISAYTSKPPRYSIEASLNMYIQKINGRVAFINYHGHDTVKSKK